MLSEHLPFQKPLRGVSETIPFLRSGKSVGRPSDLGTLPCTEIAAGRRGARWPERCWGMLGVPGMGWQMKFELGIWPGKHTKSY